MSKLACHMQKNTRGKVGGLQRHCQRENENYSNECIDKEKSYLNYDLANDSGINHLKKVDSIIENCRTNSNKAIRKDAIVQINTIVSAENEYFRRIGSEETKRFFQESYNYLSKKVGADHVVAANVHMDETTPHMHFTFVPIKDGALSAKKVMTRTFLRELQEDFPKYLQKKGFDIERGMENSMNKHKTELEFKKLDYQDKLDEMGEKYRKLQNASKNLSKLESEDSLLRYKINNISPKKSLLGGKVTITEDEFNELKDLAHKGQDKLIENIKLKHKVADMSNDIERYDALNKDKLRRIESLQSENKELKIQAKKDDVFWGRVERALNNLGLTEQVRGEFDRLKEKDNELMKSKNRRKSYDMER